MTLTTTRRSVLGGLAAGTATLALPQTSFGQTASVRIGTSSAGSVFYTLAVGIGEMIREFEDINSTVEPVGGSAANVNGIANDNVDLAIANSFASYSGYNGEFGFANPLDLRLVVQGQASNRWLFVREGSGITSPADLAGKTVIGERRSLPELKLVTNAILEQFGVDPASVNIVGTAESGETIDAIRTGSVDAILMPFSRKAGQIEEPMHDGVMTALQVSKEDRDGILARLPQSFYGVDLPANDFSNQTEEVPVIALNTYLISSPDLDADLVYKIARTLFDNPEKFSSYHATARQWTVDNTLVVPALPYHDGVIRYFEEVGVWTDAHQAKQDELLAR